MTNASDEKRGAPEGAGCGSSLATWPAAREGGALSVRPQMLLFSAVVRKQREQQRSKERIDLFLTFEQVLPLDSGEIPTPALYKTCASNRRPIRQGPLDGSARLADY